jgi:release factor glutamine methyltransferase
MPERGSRCLSDREDDLPAFVSRISPTALRTDVIGTIDEMDDRYRVALVCQTEVGSPRTSSTRGWASWCSSDTFGGGSGCDEFGLEYSSGTRQETYSSWQRSDEFGSELVETSGLAGCFSPTSSDSDRSSEEEGSLGNANGTADTDDDDDCWEAWLDARKSKTAASKQVEPSTNKTIAPFIVVEERTSDATVDLPCTVSATGESSAPIIAAASTSTNSAEPVLIPTPEYGKLHESVYEPAEDSFILLDALEADAAELRASKPTICLEIGSGSGIASAFLSTIVEPSSALFMSTDINPHACLATQATSILNRAHLNPINTNLVSPILERVQAAGGADVLVFNPPYVPTDEDELTRTQLEAEIGATWAGGVDGMVVTNVVLDLLPRLLNPNSGRIYLVAVSANQPAQIISRMSEYGLQGEVSCALLVRFTCDRMLMVLLPLQIVLKRRAGREMLHVIKLTRRS